MTRSKTLTLQCPPSTFQPVQQIDRDSRQLGSVDNKELEPKFTVVLTSVRFLYLMEKI